MLVIIPSLVHVIILVTIRCVSLFHLLNLIVAVSNLTVHIVDLVFNVLFHLLSLLELFLNDQAMVSLHDLLVDKLVPRLCIQFVIEIEVVAISLLGLQRIHLKAVPNLVVNRGSQILSLGLLCHL